MVDLMLYGFWLYMFVPTSTCVIVICSYALPTCHTWLYDMMYAVARNVMDISCGYDELMLTYHDLCFW